MWMRGDRLKGYKRGPKSVQKCKEVTTMPYRNSLWFRIAMVIGLCAAIGSTVWAAKSQLKGWDCVQFKKGAGSRAANCGASGGANGSGVGPCITQSFMCGTWNITDIRDKELDYNDCFQP